MDRISLNLCRSSSLIMIE
uniref:Uncharacterized protein n=1 Tax=Anguilla anguilla TaxID=7936 RepID=A0A0E9SRC4_ANGAN